MKTRTLWLVKISAGITCHVALDLEKYDALTPATIEALQKAIRDHYAQPKLAHIDGAERIGHLILPD